MKILIAKANQWLIHNYFKRPVFESNTENTCTFKATRKQLEKAMKEMKQDGYNPYAVMTF